MTQMTRTMTRTATRPTARRATATLVLALALAASGVSAPASGAPFRGELPLGRPGLPETRTVTQVASGAPVAADAGTTANRSAKPMTIAVIGDVPYGTAQEATFGDLIGAVNQDPKVRLVTHVGDIKSGSTTCTDERFAAVKTAFDTFLDPVVYTPGDNEWTDCHRANNGSYDPLDRLDAVRSTFFAEPGSAPGGRPKRLKFQPSLVENGRWIESRVAFATLHVIGSNTWDPVPRSAQQAIADRIAARTAAFDGQVLLLQGDSHEYVGLPNFTRIVVQGETLPFEYLRLTIDPREAALFSWERVQVPQP